MKSNPFRALLRLPVAVWRLLCMGRALVHGLWHIPHNFPKMSLEDRRAYVRQFSRGIVEGLGVRIEVHGSAEPLGKLLVANHVSWLDIASIHSVLPQARMVSKADVRHWPLVGTMVDSAGTLFIERSKKRDALRVVHQIAQALKEGDCVAVFPEGTTGTGEQPLPFHANLLQAAVSVGAPILPVAVRWHEPGQRFSESAVYVGDTSLIESLWRIATARGLVVSVHLLPAVPTVDADRRVLAELVRQAVADALVAS